MPSTTSEIRARLRAAWEEYQTLKDLPGQWLETRSSRVNFEFLACSYALPLLRDLEAAEKELESARKVLDEAELWHCGKVSSLAQVLEQHRKEFP